MEIAEYAHSFGAVSAGVAAPYGIDTVFKGAPNVPWTAQIEYATIRNDSGGAVTVQGPLGSSSIGSGERKRVELSRGCRWFTVRPDVDVAAGELTADVGLKGVVW